MILFASPHLDDAAFSAGGLIARLTARGARVVVATVFTRSVENPTGFALACQTDKGLPADLDYMALRRDEDARACAVLGAEPVWLDLPEAPHRGYDSAASLFGPRRADDAVAPVSAALGPLVAAATQVFGPLCRGDHVDHHLVRDALDGLTEPVLWEDLPYALNTPDDSLAAVALSGAEAATKLDACAAYASQLGFQFGGGAAMRARLAGRAERFAAPTAAAQTAFVGVVPT